MKSIIKPFDSRQMTVAALAVGAIVSGCSSIRIDPDRGFAVGAGDREKFRKDESLCEREVETTYHYVNSNCMDTELPRQLRIRDCLLAKGWKRREGASSAPVTPSAGVVSGQNASI